MPVGLRLVRHAVGILTLALAPTFALAQRPEPSPLLRSNEPLSVHDLGTDAVEVTPDEPLPTLPVDPRPRRPLLPGPFDQEPLLTRPTLPPQVPTEVMDTQLPADNDGLQGNRQVALTPFPNLYMQSGPLAVDQLPWYHKPKYNSAYSIHRSIAYESMIGSSNGNGLPNGGFGWYNSLQLAFPFWVEREMGIQTSIVLEPTTYPQVFTTATGGFFRNAIWAEDPLDRYRLFNRVSWGFVFDGLFDSEHRALIGQFRGQTGYSLTPSREMGFWFSIPVTDDPAPIGSGQPVLIDTTAMGAAYYRQTFASELDVTGFVGYTEGPGEAMIGAYATYRFSRMGSWILSAMNNFSPQGSYSIYAGFRIDFWPMADYSLLSGNAQNLYRPFMRPADHINLQLRTRPL